jgi:hypothetical protein
VAGGVTLGVRSARGRVPEPLPGAA